MQEVPFEVLGWVFSWISEGEQGIVNQVSKNFQFIVDKKKFKIQILTGVGSVFLLRWSMINGLPLTGRVIKSSIINGKLDVLKYLAIELKDPLLLDSCKWAAKGGHIEVLRALRSGELGKVFSLETCSCEWAARGGYLEVLKALRSGELGEVCPWDKWSCSRAAKGGHLEVLRALRSGKLGGICPWDTWVYADAAQGGHLHVLRALRSGELGGVCPWDEWICERAAEGGHVDVLRALRSGELNGKCPWNKRCCLFLSSEHKEVQDLINSGELDD